MIVDCNSVYLQDRTSGPEILGNLEIDSNGTVSIPIEVATEVTNYTCNELIASEPYKSALSLFQLYSDGSTSITPIHTNTADLSHATSGRLPRAWPWNAIPDGSGGTLIAWTDYSSSQTPDYITHISSSGQNDYPFPALYQDIQTMVLGDNGMAYATDGQTVQAFTLANGQSTWNYLSPAVGGIDLVGTTSGGGLVAKEFDQNNGETTLRFNSSAIPTYDGTGNATPAPSFGERITASWTGSLDGTATASPLFAPSTAAINAPILDWADNFWVAPQGQPSPTSGSVEMPWFPPLQTCPGEQTPCAGEATWNAFKALQVLIGTGRCSLCDEWIFSKLLYPQNGYARFLNSKQPLISDGTKSKAPMNHVMCNWWDPFCAFGSETVSDYLRRKGFSAISRTPSETGPVIYVVPASICKAGTSPGTLLNESLLFHETLHGYTGLEDSGLINGLGITNEDLYGSTSITYYIELQIFGASLHYFDPGGNAPLVCKN